MITNSTSPINYVSMGGNAKEPLFFIHGIGGSLSQWVFYYSLYLMSSYKCISYDLRGHGYSFFPEQGYRVADHAGDLQLINSYFSTSARKMIAYSYGGNIALKWAIQYGSSSDKIVILDTPDLPVSKHSIAEFIHDIRAVLHNDYATKSNFASQLVNAIKDKIEEGYRPAKNYGSRLDKLAATSFEKEIVLDEPFDESDLRNIDCDILLIYATKDNNLAYAKKLKKNLQRCALVELAADHQLITTHHKEIIQLATDFFENK